MPLASGTFARIWKFVDQKSAGDEVTRSDLDTAIDDMVPALNAALGALASTTENADATAADRVQTGLDRSASAASAAQAALYDGPWFDTATALLADTTLAYGSGAGNVAAGDYVQTRAEGFSYRVAASGATDHDVITAGGVKLYVMAWLAGYNVRAFGATGDGVTDDQPVLQAARDAALAQSLTLRIPRGTYRLGSTLNLRHVFLDAGEASFDVAHAGIGVLLGGNASSTKSPPQTVYMVTRSVGTDSTTTPTVRVLGAKGQAITVERTTYLQLYADTHAVGEDSLRDLDYSIAYSTFDLKYVTTIELTNNPANSGGGANQSSGGTIQWINENIFRLNRTNFILINGTYSHNHNKFFDGTFEGTAEINIDRGNDNQIIGARFEAGPTTIVFGTAANRNIVQKTWSSSESTGSIFSQLVSGAITDSGVQNLVFDPRGQAYNKSVVASAMIADVVVNNTSGTVARDRELQRIVSGSSARVCYSQFLPVVEGDEYLFSTSGADIGDTVRYRARIEFYDKNLKPVTPLATWISSANMTTVSSNAVVNGTGVSAARARITSIGAAGAVYARVAWQTSTGQTANALARELEIVRYSKRGMTNLLPVPRAAELPVVTAIPTQGFAPLGYLASKSDGAAQYLCAFALDVATSAAAISGATVISLTDVTGLAVGDIIGVNLDDRSTHWTTVASIASLDVTLTAALTAAAASGARVVANRWVTRAGSSLSGSAVYDPSSLADGAGVTTTVTVTGAAMGDLAQASFNRDLAGVTLTAWVSATNTVSVRFQNESGGTVDLVSGTIRALVTDLT